MDTSMNAAIEPKARMGASRIPGGLNRKRPRCITQRCPSRTRCQCPEFDGPPRDYSINLGACQFCGYFKIKEEDQ
ncbi:MAG: hypothetical protein KUA34_04310 [Pseudodesulfovibrio sp.]|uniref:Uncharacterized protein n=2 Tax=Pseudodesulfovibrio aespoeensis TaxID=182210 RepID=E6VX45_PSEA9|nr:MULTISPECIES: hypothetical protein [Pseudodesulfovibrio]MBU4379787.1 hypothetical protein [Pseudomonadota bacterium]MCG2733806.1 hypothetical protein [Pseudodesulfovibrio aespoeensis]ADU61451.1 hypothetical protein Daes_0427 [Pseudodesulfovibrio aespoeensis Aspo-2]MBU4475249.1 hypothetical protein [Pseudomonadota bacterium]MBV1764235.1 hypothetical protein [Pseudodesulfovibrio sp.]